MTYDELIEYMHRYRAGSMTKSEMAVAIALWQITTVDFNKRGIQ